MKNYSNLTPSLRPILSCTGFKKRLNFVFLGDQTVRFTFEGNCMGKYQAVLYSMSSLMGEDYEDENLMENQIHIGKSELKDLRAFLGPRKWRSKIIRSVQDELMRELKKGKKDHLCPDLRDVIKSVLSQLGQGEPTEELIESIVAVFNRLSTFTLHPYTQEVLKAINDRNYIQGIISNTIIPVRYYANELTKMKINEYFYTIITSADVGYFKPKKEVFLFALESIGLLPEDVTFIADDLNTDITGALQLGMKTILVNRYTTKPEAPEGVTVVYGLKDILNHLPLL